MSWDNTFIGLLVDAVKDMRSMKPVLKLALLLSIHHNIFVSAHLMDKNSREREPTLNLHWMQACYTEFPRRPKGFLPSNYCSTAHALSSSFSCMFVNVRKSIRIFPFLHHIFHITFTESHRKVHVVSFLSASLQMCNVIFFATKWRRKKIVLQSDK